ncbi:MAG: hypothetical protein ACXWJ2_07740, partial [Hyphomicrobium sp.]
MGVGLAVVLSRAVVAVAAVPWLPIATAPAAAASTPTAAASALFATRLSTFPFARPFGRCFRPLARLASVRGFARL